MTRVLLTLSLIAISCLSTNAQLLKWAPAFIQEGSSSISITANATQGNKGLMDYAPANDVFVHIGAITNLSNGASDWKYVKFTWGTTNGAANAANTGSNQWTFTINGGLRNFFGITNGAEKIQKIAILFRSGNGNKVLRNEDASDMYIPVYDNGNFVRIDNPVSHPDFSRTLVALDKKMGDNISITGLSNLPADLKVYHNGNAIGTASTATTITANSTILVSGTQKFLLEANFGSSTIIKDSISFFVTGPASTAALPSGISDGITYEKGDTSAYLVLFAPGKSRIAVIGDFNNWAETQEGQMTKTPDGNRFWIRLTGLTPGKEYAYQYLIDGQLKVADYNTEKVLDPSNDSYIPTTTYPNLKPYPTGKTTGIVGVLQTAKPVYNWKVQNFNRPDKRNLVIYELLIRDFVATRNFQTLRDTISYLKRLGVNAIELMPFSEFEGNLSWGYNPNFFFALDKFYGTENAVKEFIDACHQQGIAVIMDIVLNHAFGSSPHAQMYWDGTNNKPSSNNPWLNPDAKHPFNVGNDFNHESQATKDLVARITRHWLTNYKIDGFRWDLSKGFTQTNNPSNVSAWGNYDASRVAIWKRIYDSMQVVSPSSYCILEHFADNTEERELSNHGMLLWGNANHNFNQATMGYAQDADFSWVTSQKRGWEKPHLVGYMESHDEERLMYKNLNQGNQSTTYSTRDSISALKRMGQAAAFWAMIPGPKMLWQFGELGFPYSINTCTDGTVNNNCRLDNKNPVWESYNDVFKRGLFDVYSNLIRLRLKPNYLTTFTTDKYAVDFSSAVKTLQINDDSLKVVVVGNFDIISKTATINFPSSGTWHSYLTKTSINVNGGSASLTLQPGEYHVYFNKDLSNNLVTAITNPALPTLDAKLKIYPNPVHNESTITYAITKSGRVKIELLDPAGKVLETLFDAPQRSGNHSLPVPPTTLAKLRKKAGIHFVLLRTLEGQQSKKIVIAH